MVSGETCFLIHMDGIRAFTELTIAHLFISEMQQTLSSL